MNEQIVAAARALIGTPFRHQGRIPGAALDCAGVVCAALDSVGISYIDMDGYPRMPYEGMLETQLAAQPSLVQIPVSDIEPGDVLLMRFSAEPQHLAVFAGETVIHAYERVGKCCEHRLSDVWRARIVRAYRVEDKE